MKGWEDVSCQLSVVRRREARAASASASSEARARARVARREWRNAFRLPPSAFRLGLSLTEVLIAMGILTLGLLGVAVVFPVGSFYMQKAEIADRGSAIAQSVMSDIMARGMLNPAAWFVIVPPNGCCSSE